MAKIPELPHNERPRERLARLGASALSDAELLAIFLRVGVKGSSAIEVGRSLLRTHGSLSELGGMSVSELSKEHGLGTAKAAQLLAAYELGVRCAKERMASEPMNSAEAIYASLGPRLSLEKKEHVLIVLLDSKLHAKRTIELSVGNSTMALCEPRDVMHHVLVNQAGSFVLVHNHPSGDPSPSKQDMVLTKKLLQASELMHVRFVDHVIIGRPSAARVRPFYSFAAAGVMI